MGAAANLAESHGWQKPAAQSKFRCLIIKIGDVSGFWRAALRITPYFYPEAGPCAQSLVAGVALFHPDNQLLGLTLAQTATPRQEFCDLIS
jgi:hypothetical protein